MNLTTFLPPAHEVFYWHVSFCSQGESLSRGVSVRGGGSLSGEGGLCPGRGVSVRGGGSLSVEGVSVQRRGSLWGGDLCPVRGSESGSVQCQHVLHSKM